jgi:hypothetical protein
LQRPFAANISWMSQGRSISFPTPSQTSLKTSIYNLQLP